jgi:UDP-N-acetylglucosamine transferase subunit ALG13
MMIFVTAGTQLPFDRLVKTIDEIATQDKFFGVKFVVQALKSRCSNNIELLGLISSAEFDSYIDKADLIISHAGTGTIISALVNKKPIIVIPRLVKYNEHRNDHQLATAKQMDALNYVHVAYDENELKNMLNDMWPDNLTTRRTISNEASKEIMNALNNFIKF